MEIGYIEKMLGRNWVNELNEIIKMLHALKKKYASLNPYSLTLKDQK